MLRHEARKHQRLPAYLGARIHFEHKASTFDCLIKNISDKGALIAIEGVWDIPETFHLYIAKFDKSYSCHAKWKTGNKLGVSYNKNYKVRSEAI